MAKVKHGRTADCVLAGYRLHNSLPGAVGALLLGLYADPRRPTSRWGERARRADPDRRGRPFPGGAGASWSPS